VDTGTPVIRDTSPAVSTSSVAIVIVAALSLVTESVARLAVRRVSSALLYSVRHADAFGDGAHYRLVARIRRFSAALRCSVFRGSAAVHVVWSR
jgi:hypothetical protein